MPGVLRSKCLNRYLFCYLAENEKIRNTYHYIKETYGKPDIEFGYKDFIPMFTAEEWDPDRWAKLLKGAGGGWAAIISKKE
jgi:alpha-L-fucosidase